MSKDLSYMPFIASNGKFNLPITKVVDMALDNANKIGEVKSTVPLDFTSKYNTDLSPQEERHSNVRQSAATSTLVHQPNFNTNCLE